MEDIKRIIEVIDKFLEKKNQAITTPPEANSYLEKEGILKDNNSRKGLPLRKLLRDGKIPHAFKVGVYWQIPHSGGSKRNLNPIRKGDVITAAQPVKKNTDGHKLTPIGSLIVELLEEKYGKKTTFELEFKPKWLLSYPDKQLIKSCSEISTVYSELTDNQFSIEDKLGELTSQKLRQKQSYDIWIGEPFNFAVEFDEKQHFNQFRKITLEHYNKIEIKFPLQVYKELNKEIEIKPGNSGFTKLKSNDPLFSEMLEGNKQDNRIRQRAFRDFLKDILPVKKGFNPTLRIPYHVINKKIKNFNEQDISKVKNYILNHELL